MPRLYGSMRSLTPARVVLAGLAGLFAASGATAQEAELYKLSASDAEPLSRFGAALDVDGELAIVGAQGAGEGGSGAGAAYVFEFTGGEWVESAKLTSDAPGFFQRFGAHVAVQGERIVVGEPDVFVGPFTDGNLGIGHVFERVGDAWVRTAKLTAVPIDGVEQRIGGPVALHGDTIVFGDPAQNGSASESGAIYIFRKRGSEWGPAQRIVGSSGSARFGAALALQARRLLVGAPGDSSAGPSAGACHVLEERDEDWGEVAKLTAEEPQAASAFGVSVALDRGRALVGASELDTDGFQSRGGAYVFVGRGADWQQEALLVPGDSGHGDEFAASVDLQGGRAIGGSRNHPAGSRFGAGYLFERAGATWVQTAKFVSSEPKIGQRLGEQVRLNGASALVSTSLFENSTGAVFYYQPRERSALSNWGAPGARAIPLPLLGWPFSPCSPR